MTPQAMVKALKARTTLCARIFVSSLKQRKGTLTELEKLRFRSLSDVEINGAKLLDPGKRSNALRGA